MFETINQALNHRTYRDKVKKYEQALEEHHNTCKSIARTFVSGLLNTIAEDNSQEYILMLSWYNYAFGTLPTMLSNQLVKATLPIFPEAPTKPVDPNADATKEESSKVNVPLYATSWQFIKEALKKANIPYKELTLTCEPILYINLSTKDDTKEELLKDTAELDNDPNAVNIDEFI